MKICILIIYSENENYIKMKEILTNYYNNFKNIKFYFTQFRDQENDVELENNILFVKGEELYLNILHKTIVSMKYILENNEDLDFLIRTNVSTVINIENLINFCNSIDKTNIYCGGRALTLSWCDSKGGIPMHDYTYFGLQFIGGDSIIFSKDIVEDIIKHRDKLNYKLIDDVSFGSYMKTYHNINYETNNAMCVEITESNLLDSLVNCKNITFFRNINYWDREKDLQNMTTIINGIL